MRNLLLLSAAVLSLAACQGATTNPTNTGSMQSPSMAFPAPPPNTGVLAPASSLSTPVTTTGQGASMSPASPTVGIATPDSSLPQQPTGGQAPSMAAPTAGAGVLHVPGTTPTISP